MLMPDVHPGKLAEYRHRERNAQDGYDGHEDARLGEIRYAEVAGRVGDDVGGAGRDHDEAMLVAMPAGPASTHGSCRCRGRGR